MPTYLGYGITFPVVWAGSVRAAGVAFPIVGFILVGLRLNARRWQRLAFKADDVFGVIALLTLAGMGGCFVYGANHHALGWRIPPTDGNDAQQIANHNSRTNTTRLLVHLQYVWQLFMVLTYGFTKLSIVWFCRRIFVAHRRTVLDLVTLGLTGLLATWTTAFFLAFIFYCRGHPSAFWGSPLEAKKYCLNIAGAGHRLQYSLAISNMILDVVCVSLPFPVIWRLQLSTVHKLTLSGIFLIGLTTIAASIARIIAYYQVDGTSKDPKEDPMLGTTICLYWAMLEAGLGFIASQLPSLSPYLTRGSGMNITSSLRRALSWVSLRTLGSPSGSRDGVSTQPGDFHELHDNGQSRHQRQDSDATQWSAPSLPKAVKTTSSRDSLMA